MESDRAKLIREDYKAEFDWGETDEPIHTILDGISELKNDVGPDPGQLYEAVDPDALSAIFRPITEMDRRDGQVVFPIDGCKVTVYAEGRVRVQLAETE